MDEDIVKKYCENYKKEMEQALQHRSDGFYSGNFQDWSSKQKDELQRN